MKRLFTFMVGTMLLTSGFSSTAFANDIRTYNRSELVEVTADDISLDYFADYGLVSEKITVIADSLRTMIENGATDDELDEYVESAMSRERYDLYSLINDKLNSQEEALFAESSFRGVLALANAQFATNYAETHYNSNVLHNDNGDAFRHILWNYGMVIDIGYTWAKKWSDAHEYGAVGQPSIERSMDLHNNAIGLRLGQDNPGTILHNTFINKSREQVRNGNARIILGGRLTNSDSYGEK